MKRIVILIIFMISVMLSFAQNDEVDKLTLRDSMMSYKNSIKSTIIEVLTDGTVRLKNIADPINDADGVNKLWVLNQGGVTAVDSTSLNPANAELYLWKGGVAVDTTELDIGYFAVGDLADYVPLSGATVIYVTPVQMNDSIAAAAPSTIFSVTLPYASTVAGRIALAVEGTDYPAGWILTADGINLIVTHGLGRWVYGVAVWGNTTGIEQQQLFDSNAYTGLTATDNNNLKIFGLSVFPKEIIVRIAFE